MSKLSERQAEDLLRYVARGREDFVYHGYRYHYDYQAGTTSLSATERAEPGHGACAYRNRETGAADCIIGQVADLIGVLDDIEEETSADGQGVLLDLFAAPAVTLLGNVQRFQDSGVPWGEAIDKATLRAVA